MTSRQMTSSRAGAGRELGRTPFAWPTVEGQTRFELTTHLSGRSSLRHFLLGLRKIERMYEEAELIQVNRVDVRTWSHTKVVSFINEQLSVVTDNELKMTVRAKDDEGRKHILEIVISVISEDGIGDAGRAGFDIFVRAIDKIVTTPDVTDVEFESSYYLRIRHGAQTGYFLKEGSDHALCMDHPPSDSQEYVFRCYNFIGHNQERRGGGGGGGGGKEGEEDSYPRLCVLQQPCSEKFVAACPISGRLKLDDDSGFGTDIQSITAPDCHFFIVHRSGDGGDTFCLQPLVMRSYYLRYDSIDGLKLQKRKKPPYKDFTVVRFFSFRFVQVNDPPTSD